jgi:hypothetical protein
LKATAATPEERLHLLGKRVQVPTHANADSLFKLADLLPLILTMIEEDQFRDVGDVPNLYTPADPPNENPLQIALVDIVSHWSRATKTDIKSLPIETTPAMAGR